jgi:chondroitin 4-sulfotransferase 11
MLGWMPRPFVFVHIPKCAGTSIEKALIPFMSTHCDFREFSELERRAHWMPGREGRQHCRLGRYAREYDLSQFLKFSIVRNPWDRAISQINYLRSKTGKNVFSGNSLKENIEIYCKSTRNIWAHDLSASQCDYLQVETGKLATDFVGKFENLTEDFARICHLIGVENAPVLPHIFNSGSRTHYSSHYDSDSREWVRKRFACDVEIFGYEFDEG